MSLPLIQQLLDRDGLHASERTALVEVAQRLHRAQVGGGLVQPLKGRHVAISGADHQLPSAQLFERAAVGLGARVSHIGPDAMAFADGRSYTAARLLGSLYDAIDGVALQPARARELQDLAGVPVYSDLGGEASPLRALVPAVAAATPEAGPAAEDDAMLCLVQAVLVETLS